MAADRADLRQDHRSVIRHSAWVLGLAVCLMAASFVAMELSAAPPFGWLVDALVTWGVRLAAALPPVLYIAAELVLLREWMARGDGASAA